MFLASSHACPSAYQLISCIHRVINSIVYVILFWILLFVFQDGKEKQAAPPGQLNIIRLLSELNVYVRKPEVVDMILPLFIESLEEGDASNAGLLRLRVCSYLFTAPII